MEGTGAVTDLLLTLNAGSSSVKFALFTAEASPVRLAAGQVENLARQARFKAARTGETAVAVAMEPQGPATHGQAVAAILAWLEQQDFQGRVMAVGHRVVHGGPRFADPAIIAPAVMEALAALVPLAPLHQPHNLAAIAAAQARFPGVPQIACFDTAFHRGQPFVADVFGLPRAFYAEGVRRYGFHGLSYESIVTQLRGIDPALAQGRLVVAHLGNGASACAIAAGRSVASTMGFTAVDGLPMGTRSGQLDPGVLLYLMAEHRMDHAALTDLLYNRSGLLGLSDLSNDMRELEASGRPEAGEAIAYFAYRLRREIGSLAAALGGLDGIVFTGGIGEHSSRLRGEVLPHLQWLGVEYDDDANRSGTGVISRQGSPVTVRVVATDEEAMIARHALRAASATG
jgi:acetate kinase